MSSQGAEEARGGGGPRGEDRSGRLGTEPLSEAVDRAVAAVREWRRRAAAAEDRAKRSDELLRQFVGGESDPAALTRRLAELEAENRQLRARVETGRREVDRVLARIRFLENGE